MKKIWVYLLIFLYAKAIWASNTNSIETSWHIYIFGDVNVAAAIFNLIAKLITQSSFLYLLDLVLILGLGWGLFIAVAKPLYGVAKVAKWILTVGFIVRLILAFNANVTLVNFSAAKQAVKLTAVPAVLAIPAALISQAGYWFAQMIDQAFIETLAVPMELTLTKNQQKEPVIFSAANQKIIASLQPNFIIFSQERSLRHFLANCLVPALTSEKIAMNKLINHNDLWQLMGLAASQALITTFYSVDNDASSEQTLTCHHAYEKLQEQVKATTLNQQKDFIPIYTYLFAESLPVENYVMQLIAINAFKHLMARNAYTNAAMLSGLTNEHLLDPAALLGQSFFNIFLLIFAYLYSSLQMLIYVLAPIMFLLILLPEFGRALFINYLRLLVWFMLTLVFFVLCQDLLTVFIKQVVVKLLEQYQGISLLSIAYLEAELLKLNYLAVTLMLLVPLLAWLALAKTRANINARIAAYASKS